MRPALKLITRFCSAGSRCEIGVTGSSEGLVYCHGISLKNHKYVEKFDYLFKGQDDDTCKGLFKGIIVIVRSLQLLRTCTLLQIWSPRVFLQRQ